MINLYNYNGFVIEDIHSPESKQLQAYCIVNDIYFERYFKIPNNLIPVGSVEFCEKILEYSVLPNYYPEWLSHKFYRKIWKSNKWIKGYFVKPADRFKRFNGFIIQNESKEKPPFYYSEVVDFSHEFRYYITGGKNLGGFQYLGDEIKVPELNFDIPENFYGTIDMGFINSKLALVECHPPFACGWYGSYYEVHIFLQWLIDGWRFLNDSKNIKNM